ncbi:hypothetical protein [Pseudooceanicola atlanticus]|uniref:hypothetical protein n=1 Tax=Pseudooceanicola atlanticus TaxID=1461694 RepID=UPI00235590E6|nr:hypothetical protein [Pseudooceanicola atlanticus]
MRKIDPEGVWSDFESQLHDQLQYFQHSWEALDDAANRKIATENYALTIGVMFEGYINDLIFAYANRDCSQVVQHLENSVRECLAGTRKAQTAFDKFGEFNQRSHLTKAELKEILDPDGRNTSFPDYAAIEDRAQQWLAPAHRGRFENLGQQERAVINATISVRNNLAHRSKGSLDRLNQVFEAGALHPTGLRRNVNRIQQAGHYLKARVNGEARVVILARLLRNASDALVH